MLLTKATYKTYKCDEHKFLVYNHVITLALSQLYKMDVSSLLMFDLCFRNIIINDINLSMKMVSFQMRLDVKKALSFRMVDIKNVLNEDVLEIAKKCSLAHMQVVQNQNVCDLV